jgi:8-amino-7-oxononanoate synthase
LQKRISESSLRKLSVRKNLVDFCSNDYLGFGRSAEISNSAWKHSKDRLRQNGSSGSRLISGNTEDAENLEQFLAGFHQSEAGLLFNSGYDANLGLFSSVPGRNDTVIYDEYIHTSVKDGIRLSPAKKMSFRHNNIEHLEEKIKSAQGNIFVVIESVYSMDGDIADLKKTADVCQKYTAFLIVDEAHSNGIFGEDGRGLCVETGIADRIFARVYTFGKALGCHGAVVCGSQMLKEYLINFARSFIYTTAMPLHSLHTIFAAYEYLPMASKERKKLFGNIEYYQNYISEKKLSGGRSKSPIQYIDCKGNTEALDLSESIQESGFDVRPILSPTVPGGKERLRICLHAFNDENQIRALLDEIVKFKK